VLFLEYPIALNHDIEFVVSPDVLDLVKVTLTDADIDFRVLSSDLGA
jgi:hypothetical protein